MASMASPQKRFETFVMTGDVMLETTSPSTSRRNERIKMHDSEAVLSEHTTTEVADESSSANDADSSNTASNHVLSNGHSFEPEITSDGNEEEAAIRMARRLYHLDGFRRSDVAAHIYGTSSFASLTARHYLAQFDFTGLPLDGALRLLLERCALSGETQQRERVLVHLSQRYVTCNPRSFASHDACHTLTCALMLLNTDLHGQNIGKKMSGSEFIANLAGLNDGAGFSREILTQLYAAIRDKPLQWALDDDALDSSSCPSPSNGATEQPNVLGENPFLQIPDPSTTEEICSGLLKRKCICDVGGKKTPVGRRGWRAFYASLRELVLYLYKPSDQPKDAELAKSRAAPTGVLHVHHSLCARATDYRRRAHVLRLTTADGAQYLLRTKSSGELQGWADAINLTAASLSAPPLPGAVGSQRKFTRPVLPSSRTRLSVHEQLADHEQRALDFQRELELHQASDARTREASVDFRLKLSYLELEIQRYRTYTLLLSTRLATPVNGAADKQPSDTGLGTPNRSQTDSLTAEKKSDSTTSETRRDQGSISRADSSLSVGKSSVSYESCEDTRPKTDEGEASSSQGENVEDRNNSSNYISYL